MMAKNVYQAMRPDVPARLASAAMRKSAGTHIDTSKKKTGRPCNSAMSLISEHKWMYQHVEGGGLRGSGVGLSIVLVKLSPMNACGNLRKVARRRRGSLRGARADWTRPLASLQ